MKQPWTFQKRQEKLNRIVVKSAEMQAIEGRIFAAGMPVSALMEKVVGLITRRVQQLLEQYSAQRIGVLVGPGHNGGDALVVARELYFLGYEVLIYCPFSKLKELTQNHADYTQSLGISFVQEISALESCEILIDGFFGFGLDRAISAPINDIFKQINHWQKRVISIDLPSGLHTDTGEALGIAIRATHTLCLGLWKLGLLQDCALEYAGKVELIDFDIPLADIEAVLGTSPTLQRVTSALVLNALPLPRPPVTHKYQQGHLLLICGSRRYAGGAILTGLGARASGVGMLSMAVPESLKSVLTHQLPDALIIPCPETQSGGIASLPDLDLSQYNAIACGPGLTPEPQAILQQVLECDRPLILDADGLNLLVQLGVETLKQRSAPTVLTPHAGEFKRLFPEVANSQRERILAAQQAAQSSQAIVLFKGARTVIANPQGSAWIIPESTPALARGGSGDVLTGLMGGLIATMAPFKLSLKQPLKDSIEPMVIAASWWHAQAGILAAQDRTELGVDAQILAQYLIPALQSFIQA